VNHLVLALLFGPAAGATDAAVTYHCGAHRLVLRDEYQTAVLDDHPSTIEWSEDTTEPAREAVIDGHHVAIDAGGRVSIDDEACRGIESNE
jgi:hypothetical protein